MIEKTKWVIESRFTFGKRRVWKDGIGFFYVVHNRVYRNYPGGDDFEVYEAERVTDVHDDNVQSSSAFEADALIADPLSQELMKRAASNGVDIVDKKVKEAEK